MKALEKIGWWARHTPEKIAHESMGRTLTYAELWRRSDAVASHLQQHAGQRQAPVAVIGHKEPEMLIAFLGCAKAGHPYTPLDTSSPQARIDSILQRLEPAIVLRPEDVAALPDASAHVAAVAGDDIVYTIFTSGSTGEPKGVPIKASSLDFFNDWIHTEHQLQDEVFLNQAPFCFDLSVMDLYPCLTSGGRLVSLTRDVMVDPRKLFPVLEAAGITSWVSTPSFARLCAADDRFQQTQFPTLRRFLFCGETLPPALAEELLTRFPKAEVWNTYGPTEATVATTSVRLTKELVQRYETVPVGFPTPGSSIRILDESLQELPAGARGEIVISGPNLSPGYLAAPQKAQAFAIIDGRWSYRTGDAGRMEDGMLFFDGRMDLQIKLNGYRIELGDMESHLCKLPGVRDAIVMPIYEHGAVTSLTAKVIPSDTDIANETSFILSLRSSLRKRLPDYMLPKRIQLVKSFPMTTNGKVDRAQLASGV